MIVFRQLIDEASTWLSDVQCSPTGLAHQSLGLPNSFLLSQSSIEGLYFLRWVYDFRNVNPCTRLGANAPAC